MEEKKLTDEEIVKALEVCMSGKGCEGCPYFENGTDCIRRSEKDTLDFIHRLQDENEDLHEKRMDAEFAIDKWMEDNKKQKEEIERLTKKVENQKAVIKGQNKAIEKEKAESKRLYDEYVRLDDFCATKGCICCVCENKKSCNECKTCGSLKTEKCNGFKIDVSKYTRAIERVGKLQKQVDELLNRRIEPKIFQCHADTLETCPKVEQAVKDTAKEILQGLEERKERVEAFYGIAESVGVDIAIRAVKEIVKQKGVEVE